MLRVSIRRTDLPGRGLFQNRFVRGKRRLNSSFIDCHVVDELSVMDMRGTAIFIFSSKKGSQSRLATLFHQLDSQGGKSLGAC
jgi:hypothetical protein